MGQKPLFEHPKWSRNNFRTNLFFALRTMVDPPLAPTWRGPGYALVPPSAHGWRGVGVSSGKSEGCNPQKLVGFGWTMCPRNSDLTHVAQDTARFWF